MNPASPRLGLDPGTLWVLPTPASLLEPVSFFTADFFHLHLGQEEDRQPRPLTRAFPTPRRAVDYIMESFPIVRRNDEQKYGDYRIKLLILDIYDRMQEAIATGRLFETILSPPPADPSVAHPATENSPIDGRMTV